MIWPIALLSSKGKKKPVCSIGGLEVCPKLKAEAGKKLKIIRFTMKQAVDFRTFPVLITCTCTIELVHSSEETLTYIAYLSLFPYNYCCISTKMGWHTASN